MLANFLSAKMSVCDPLHPAHELPKKTNIKYDRLKFAQADVLKVLKQVDPQNAMGPDKISPHTLFMCALELAGPPTKLFQMGMLQKKLA